MRGRILEVVIYFKFHENRSRGLGAVGGRKSPSPIDKAHGLYNSLYYRTSVIPGDLNGANKDIAHLTLSSVTIRMPKTQFVGNITVGEICTL